MKRKITDSPNGPPVSLDETDCHKITLDELRALINQEVLQGEEVILTPAEQVVLERWRKLAGILK